MMVPYAGLMVAWTAVVIGLIPVDMMINVVICLGDGQRQLAGVIVCHAGGMLDLVDHAGRRGTREYK